MSCPISRGKHIGQDGSCPKRNDNPITKTLVISGYSLTKLALSLLIKLLMASLCTPFESV